MMRQTNLYKETMGEIVRQAILLHVVEWQCIKTSQQKFNPKFFN